MTKQDMCNLYGGHNHHHHDHHHHHHHLDGGVPRFLPRKPMKKDRHSKIYTAQGLRDRRVRLSIEIAREFFDLQDMLGFDKASKTLEWLLSKSKKAIKDLARTKLSSTSCAKSSSLTSECEGDEEEQEQEQEDNEQANNEVVDNNEIILEGTVVSKRKKMLKEKNMRKLDEAAAALQHLRTAKESRAKARARARERTREKMCTVLKIHDPKKCPPTLHPSSTNPSSSQILNQLRTMNQFHGCERSSPKIVATAEIIEAIQESSSSIMSRRKLQKPTLISSFQQQHHHHQQLNEISSKGGQTSNDNNNTNNNTNSMFCPNLPQNWDINSPLIATTRPSFRTITNMNLSTELQIYGKTMGGQ
ncbi:hypothetical protein FEM48_Zijuj04G0069500 [Ziziphus jujuba var. spinosa]|nr:hypothetical protein FEM48_Zijuj04G0069500 [Ziziphus jujuba var. spinosa]